MIPHVRAAAILGAMLASALLAVPLPRHVKRSRLETPLATEELGRWSGLLGSVGVDLSVDDLRTLVWTVGEQGGGVRRTVRAPIAPLADALGVGQSWGLFTYPDTFPHRLVVETRDGGGAPWERRYEGMSATHTWRREQFVYRRLRGIYDGQTTSVSPTWDAFARWTARAAFADFPGATHTRVMFLRSHTRAPGEPPDPERALRHIRVVARDQVGA
jgi:hypothetical protein